MGALLKPQREKFAQNIVAGMSQRDAYLDAYPTSVGWSGNGATVKACELMKEQDIIDRINELQGQVSYGAVLQRQERMELLTRIALDEDLNPKYRMQALDILNKMDGEYVKKFEAVLTPGPVTDTAAAVAAILDE